MMLVAYKKCVLVIFLRNIKITMLKIRYSKKIFNLLNNFLARKTIVFFVKMIIILMAEKTTKMNQEQIYL
jgi:hypothetical protein